jgi:hypothetical protein
MSGSDEKFLVVMDSMDEYRLRSAVVALKHLVKIGRHKGVEIEGRPISEASFEHWAAQDTDYKVAWISRLAVDAFGLRDGVFLSKAMEAAYHGDAADPELRVKVEFGDEHIGRVYRSTRDSELVLFAESFSQLVDENEGHEDFVVTVVEELLRCGHYSDSDGAVVSLYYAQDANRLRSEYRAWVTANPTVAEEAGANPAFDEAASMAAHDAGAPTQVEIEEGGTVVET